MNTSFFSTFVYGAPEAPKRQDVWDQLTYLASVRSDPWFLIGDFNEILDNSKKSRGRDRAESSFSGFRTFLSSCDLFDLRHSENFLSW